MVLSCFSIPGVDEATRDRALKAAPVLTITVQNGSLLERTERGGQVREHNLSLDGKPTDSDEFGYGKVKVSHSGSDMLNS